MVTFLQNGEYASSDSTRITWEENWKRATQSLILDNETVNDDNSSSNNIKLAAIQDMFHQLWNLYSDSTRFYHTTVHIEEMLSVFKLMTTNYGDFLPRNFADNGVDASDTIVILAIFFHDAIYDGKSSTNEEDSALLFEEFADRIEIDETIKNKIAAYIIATKTHQVAGNQDDPYLDLFLDLDMAVLGKNQSAYTQYASLIRQEYDFVPVNVYCEKRAEILESFLKLQSVYRTSIMKAELEERSHSNLSGEIDRLRQGLI